MRTSKLVCSSSSEQNRINLIRSPWGLLLESSRNGLVFMVFEEHVSMVAYKSASTQDKIKVFIIQIVKLEIQQTGSIFSAWPGCRCFLPTTRHTYDTMHPRGHGYCLCLLGYWLRTPPATASSWRRHYWKIVGSAADVLPRWSHAWHWIKDR